MKPRIIQVPPQRWPSGYGEIVAMINEPFESLVARYSLRPFEGTDNLGDYDAAIIQLPSGRRVGLARHRGDPDPGTEVHADSHDDAGAVARELLDVMGLPPATCTWLRQHVPASAGSAAGG